MKEREIQSERQSTLRDTAHTHTGTHTDNTNRSAHTNSERHTHAGTNRLRDRQTHSERHTNRLRDRQTCSERLTHTQAVIKSSHTNLLCILALLLPLP